MNKRSLCQRAYLPVIFRHARCNDNFCLCRIVGRIELLRGQKLICLSWHLHHRHHATRGCPYRFQPFPLLVIQIARVLFFCGHKEPKPRIVRHWGNSIAFIEGINCSFFDLKFHANASFHVFLLLSRGETIEVMWRVMISGEIYGRMSIVSHNSCRCSKVTVSG